MQDQTLEPAAALAGRNPIRHPGESEDYRAARQALLVEEYELRRHIERVARMRRQLPAGAEVRDYGFEAETGPTSLSQLFGSHDTLIVYSYMFGPGREKPCPMCSSFMAATAPRVSALRQRAGIVFTARSPIARLVEWKRRLGFADLPVVSDGSGEYTRDWVHPGDADVPGLSVFTKGDGVIRHFWSGEMTESDPGEDPRSAPEIDPLWAFLDMTPAGRGAEFYPPLATLDRGPAG